MNLFRESLLHGLRNNLDTSIVAVVQDILRLADGPDRNAVIDITFSDILGIKSITTIDECLAELISPSNLGRVQNIKDGVINGCTITELEKILKCDRTIILKTMTSLGMPGGMNGRIVKCEGSKRGKRYLLEKQA